MIILPKNTALGSMEPSIFGGSLSNFKIGGMVSSSGDIVVVRVSNMS